MPNHKLTKKENKKGGKLSVKPRLDLKIQAFLKVKPRGGADNDTLYIQELHKIATKHENPAVRIAAIKEVWDRAYGKSKNSVELSGEVNGIVSGLTPKDRASLIKATKKKK